MMASFASLKKKTDEENVRGFEAQQISWLDDAPDKETARRRRCTYQPILWC
jgi:hypothetical protein